MIRKHFICYVFIVFVSGLLRGQNPATITFPTPTVNPANLSVDSYTRAVTKINLQPGFKYGFTSGGATNLLNLSLGTTPTFVSSNYLGSGLNPNTITCGAVNFSQSSLVGETKGKFDVSETGAATYNINIYTPPGTNGMDPNISIYYNSQKGLGLLGKSWDLGGLMSVSRDGKTPIQDGKFDGVKLDYTDMFSLNGNHLFGLTGTYGYNAATYYPEVENFSTITSHGTKGNGPQWFEVKDKNGNIYEYGKTADSRLTGKNDQTVLKWNISRKIDEFGNYIDYVYNNLNGEVVISEIIYTGNINSGLTPYNSIKFNYIETADKNTKYINGKEFNYTQILKSVSVYAEGSLVKKYVLDYVWDKQSQLAKITESDKNGNELIPTTFCWEEAGPSFIDAGLATPSENLFPQTQLANASVDFDGNGTLDKVIVCRHLSTLRLKVFNNNGPNVSSSLTYNDVFTEVIPQLEKIIGIYVTDEDYDNKQEVYIISTPNQNTSNTYFINKIVYTANNYVYSRTQKNTISNYNFTGLIINSPITTSVFYDSKDYTGDGENDRLLIDPETISLTGTNCNFAINYTSYGNYIRPFQFDEDAELEYIVFDCSNLNQLTLKVLDLNVSLGTLTQIYSYLYPVNVFSSLQFANNFSIGDFNNDKKSDLFIADEANLDIGVIYNDGQTFNNQKYLGKLPQRTNVNEAEGTTFNIVATDLNNDGFDDLLVGRYIQTQATISNGPTPFSEFVFTIKIGGQRTKFSSPIYNYDNKEYRTDAYFFYGNNFTKGGYTKELYYAQPNGDGVTSLEVDYEGDGNIDNTIASSDYLNQSFINLAGKKHQTIKQITTGLGTTINFKYANINEEHPSIVSNQSTPTLKKVNWDERFYANGSATNYNLTDLYNYKPSLFCVYETEISNTQKTITKLLKYTYQTAIIHIKGRGFMGFEQVNNFEVTCPMVNGTDTWPVAYTVNNFINPFKIPLQTQYVNGKFNGDLTNLFGLGQGVGPKFSKKTNQYTFVPRYTKGFFISLDQSDAKDYLNSKQVVTNYVYDLNSNGQPTSINSTHGWEGSSVLSKNQTLTYQLNNGYYKPDLISSSQTQAGQSAYSRSVQYSFNTNGTLLTIINDPTFGADAVTISFSNYTPFGQAQTKVISAGNLTFPRTLTTNYDAKGRFVIQKINALNYTENCTYEPAFGNIIICTDISGLQTTATYDGLGRLIQSNLPNGTSNTVSYTYENISGFPYPTTASNIGIYAITSQPQGMPYTKAYYDANGAVLRNETQGFNGTITLQDTKYNYVQTTIPSGLVLEATEPYYAGQSTYVKQQFEYEPLAYRTSKQKTVVQNPTSTAVNIFNQYTYSNPSVDGGYTKNKITITNQKGQQLKKEFNAAGQNDVVTNLKGTVNQTATYIFDSNGSPKQTNLSNAPGAPILFNYNNLGQQTQLIDPSAGTTNYNYDPIGELTKRTILNGSNNYEVEYAYDVLGRLASKTANQTGVTQYEYVTANNGKGQIKKITGPAGADQVINEYTYDALNRPTQTKETIGNKLFTYNYTYDQLGHITQYQFPNGFKVKQTFDALSYLTHIKDENNNLIWALNTVNALGQAQQFTYGNGIATNNTYTDLHYLNTKIHGSIFNQTYDFNPVTDNLNSRIFADNGVTQKENFNFDGTDRLTKSELVDNSNTVLLTNNLSYNTLGNITHKDDAGDYVYTNPNKPFTLTNINNPSPNISTNQLNVDYNDFKKAKHILEGTSNKEFDIAYGNDEDRCKMTYKIAGNNQYTRYYQSNYDRQENASGSYKEWNYIYAPTGLCAVNYNNNGTQQLLYTLTDHLGSPLLLSDASQNVVERYSFDAWGRRRDANNWNNYSVTAPQYMIRGFTMHEHLDEVGIINMNARLYDPVVGRFLQADNVIQDPDNLQNINRYGYALNNPLKYVDPSGNEYDYESNYGDDYDNGPPTFERVLAEIFPFLVESAGRYTDNVEWIWEKWSGDGYNEAGVDYEEQVFTPFNDEMNYNMNEGSTDFNDEDNVSTGMPSVGEEVNDMRNSLYALNEWNDNNPTEDVGDFIDKHDVYDYLLIHALNTPKEVVVLELFKDNETKYFVMPWGENSINESYPHIKDVGNYAEGYSKDNVKKVFHTHPKSSPPSAADKTLGDYYKIPVYTVGANGNAWIYFNNTSKPTNLESYLAK